MMCPELKISAIIPAAGAGERMGASAPKAFIEVGGKPVVFHAIDRLRHAADIERFVAPVPPGHLEELRRKYASEAKMRSVIFVPGGESRTESVSKALEVVGEDADLILVHDAVRPFVDEEVVRKTIEAASTGGAAIAAAPCSDTVKEADASLRVRGTLQRGRLWLVQTPQVFRADLLRRAYKEALREGVDATDDSALVERLGVEVTIVPSTSGNFKITTPLDMDLFRLIVENSA